MLKSFEARNTVVWLPLSFNSSNAIIAMLLLVASCVDRSLLVDTVRDYSMRLQRLQFRQSRISDSSFYRRK